MQELTGPEFEFALNGFHALTCLDGCRTGNCADQRFGCQFFFGARRGAHGRYSGRLSGEYSAWLDLKNMSMAGCRSVRRWLSGFVKRWCEFALNRSAAIDECRLIASFSRGMRSICGTTVALYHRPACYSAGRVSPAYFRRMASEGR